MLIGLLFDEFLQCIYRQVFLRSAMDIVVTGFEVFVFLIDFHMVTKWHRKEVFYRELNRIWNTDGVIYIYLVISDLQFVSYD